MNDELVSCSRLQRTALKSQRLRNPFLLKIDPKSFTCNNYVDGLEINIVCECSFWVFSFWAVKIKEFHHKLSVDWTTIKNQLIDGEFIGNDARFSNDPELYQDEYNKITHKIKSPGKLDFNSFGSSQRDSYPLVVMLILNDREIEDQIEINDIVLLASIIHLKDKQIPLDTSVIAQYIKRKSGVILNLQDLYVSSEYGEEHSPFCVICQENGINRALLPCKHACVCAECFERIDLCPLCRSPIQNYILINQPPADQPSMVQSTSNRDSEDHKTNNWYHKFINLFK